MSGLAAMLYAVSHFVLAAGLGCAGSAAARVLPLPGYGRVAFGLASTPFVSASLLLGLTLIAPGLPLPAHVVAPVVAGLVLLMTFGRQFAPIAWLRAAADWRDPVLWASLLALAAVAAVMVPRIAFYVLQPTGNSDGMQYLAQAKDLLVHRSFFAIAGIDGLPDGSLRGDAHGALWTGYNAAALAWSGLVGNNPTDEAAPRVAFQLTLVAYLAAGVALASAARLHGMVVLTVLLSLMVPYIHGSSIGGDRDAFRLAALMLLGAFLLAHWCDRMRQVGLVAMLLGVVLGGWAVQGHGLSLVFVPLIVASWAAVSLLSQRSMLRTLALSVAVAFGFGLGALHVAIAFYQTGSLTGDNLDAAKMVAGTAYAKAIAVRDAARVGEGSVLSSRMQISFARDHYWPSLMACVVVVAMSMLWVLRRHLPTSVATAVSKQFPLGWMLAVWFLSQTLLLLGVFDVGTYKLSDWTVLNLRYSMQWYLFAALLVAWGAAWFLPALAELLLKRHRLLSAMLLSIAILVIGGVAAQRLARNWAYYPTNGYRLLADKLNSLTRPLPSGCVTVSEDPGVNFHAWGSVTQLYSKYSRELVQETDPSALLRKLDQRNICAVVLYTGLYVDMAGSAAPLGQLLSGPAFRMHDAAPWRIYIRNELAPRQ